MTLTFFLAMISLSTIAGFIIDAVTTVFAPSLRARIGYNLLGTVLAGTVLGLLSKASFGFLFGALAGTLAFLMIFALIAVQLIPRRKTPPPDDKTD